MDCVLEVRPRRLPIRPAGGVRSAPDVEQRGIGFVGADDHVDVQAVFATFQRLDQQRLRFQQAYQPDVRHPFRHPVTLGQFRADLVMVALAQTLQHFQVGQLETVEVVPAFRVRLHHSCHRCEIMAIAGSSQLIA